MADNDFSPGGGGGGGRKAHQKESKLFSKVATPFQRLTAQSLKFRVTLSSLGCEDLPGGRRSPTAYLSWIRGSKKIDTPPAAVQEDNKVEWQEEMAQVVTMYYQVGKDFNLIPTPKEYSVKVKDGDTKKTLGKVKLDISKYCELESFKRTFLELETKKTGIKLFMVITTELVDEGQQQDEMSPSLTRRTLSDTYVSAHLSGGGFEVDPAEQSRQVSKSMRDEYSSPVNTDNDKTSSPLSPDLIQQSIDILHSSSSEEEEEESEGFFQAIARRMTPKVAATPSTSTSTRKKTVNRRHTIATADTQPIAKTLIFPGIDEEQEEQKQQQNPYHTPMTGQNHTNKSEPVGGLAAANPFGEVPDIDVDIDGESISATTPPSARLSDQQQDDDLQEAMASNSKLKAEVALLSSQCSQLQAENALLKDRLQAGEEQAASLSRLKIEYDKLAADHALLKKKQTTQPRAKPRSKSRTKDAAGLKDKEASQVSPASASTDMLEELIETKMKLAQAQSALDELNRSNSDNPSNPSSMSM
jgi:hypothetical protein